MALITDPDDLSQGGSKAVSDAVFGSPTGAVVTITSAGANLPAMSAGDFIEVRDHSNPVNNGLYVETGGSPTTSSITVTKLTGSNPAAASSEAITTLGQTGNLKNVHFDTSTKFIYLLEKGLLSVDGVTMLAFHSFAKEEWKSDAFLIAAAAFPMIGISFAAGQWQFGVDPSGNFSGWRPADDVSSPVSIQTRRLFRNAGWDEINSSGNTILKYFNVTTLGTFEDSANDLAYYRFGSDATDLSAAIDYEFAGPVNEAVRYFEEIAGGSYGTLAFATSSTITRSAGSFVTDGYQIGGQVTIRNAENAGNNGTFLLTNVVAGTLTVSGTPFTTNADDTTAALAVDNSNAFTTYIRVRDADPFGKKFQQANLASAGETEISSKIIKFPLANETDLDIEETDANIAANTPYTEIRVRYLGAAFNQEVDSTTKRDFGIIVDVGTYSRENGVSNGTTLFTSTGLSLGAGEDLTDYTNGTLIIHEGTDQGSHAISGTPVNNAGTLEITLSSALTGSESNLSFTVQRATPLTATKNQIYEKLHYLLRQAADIDSTLGVVNGKTADDLAVFIGPDLRLGSFFPTNPNGGGSGVLIESFDPNDTNNLFFFDNGGTSRNYPFVAAGTLNFNQGLVDDSDGEYWLYFQYTTRTTSADIDAVGPSGSTYDLEGTLPNLAVNDYIQISGFAQAANNGLFRVTVVNTLGSDYTVTKVDGTAVGTAETNQNVSVDQNPYPSPQAILVNNNAGSPIAGAIGALTAAFDFDYENNVQGGRTADTDAVVVLVAAGLETAQVAVVKNLTITKTTGLSFSITSATERNYANP